MISILNKLTNQRWDLPDAIAAQPFFLGAHPYAPGDYEVRNGSGTPLIVVYDSVLHTTVPPQSRWSVSTNENLYSWYPVAVDYAVWTSWFRGGQGWPGWAPVAQIGNI